MARSVERLTILPQKLHQFATPKPPGSDLSPALLVKLNKLPTGNSCFREIRVSSLHRKPKTLMWLHANR